MPQLIKHNAVSGDSWQTLVLNEGETAESVALPAGDVIFPLAVWQARKTEIVSCHKRIGLLLQPDDRVEDVAGDFEYFIVIAVNFPKFVDGRGYSTASLLRQPALPAALPARFAASAPSLCCFFTHPLRQQTNGAG